MSPLVRMVIVAGMESDDRVDLKGARDTGSSESLGPRTSPGDQERGALLSPKENKRANRCLAMTSRPMGRSVIDLRAKRFA